MLGRPSEVGYRDEGRRRPSARTLSLRTPHRYNAASRPPALDSTPLSPGPGFGVHTRPPCPREPDNGKRSARTHSSLLLRPPQPQPGASQARPALFRSAAGIGDTGRGERRGRRASSAISLCIPSPGGSRVAGLGRGESMGRRHAATQTTGGRASRAGDDATTDGPTYASASWTMAEELAHSSPLLAGKKQAAAVLSAMAP